MEKQTLQQRNGKTEGKDLNDIPVNELVQLLGKVYGAERMNGVTEAASIDEEYRIFSEGPHSDKQFRRVANPSYRLQREVMMVSMKCRAVTKTAKHSAADHFGWDLDDETADYAPSEELGKFQMHTKILPLMVRGGLPEDWDPEHMSSEEVERMWYDFFLNT